MWLTEWVYSWRDIRRRLSSHSVQDVRSSQSDMWTVTSQAQNVDVYPSGTKQSQGVFQTEPEDNIKDLFYP